jgi:putative transposase
MRKTFVFKLYRSKKYKILYEIIGIAAEIYNHCIALHKRYFRLYGKHLKKYRLQSHITKLKKTERYNHWNKVPSQAIQDITDRIERGYKLFFAQSKKRKVRAPSFKKRSKYKSITLKQAGYKVLKENQIKIGDVLFKYFKSREIKGTIKTLTIKRDALGDIYLYFSCEVEDVSPCRIMTGKIEGFDFGLKTYLTCSDGTKIDSPQFFKQSAKKIAKAHRKLSRKQSGSNNHKKALMEVVRCYKKIGNQRHDHRFKLARTLTKDNDVLCFETLNIKTMQKIWGRKISDLGFSDFLSCVKYYCKVNRAIACFIDRFYPSSKTCHVCQKVFEELSLKDRIWQCFGCGTLHDRDINAAINIMCVGASTLGLGDIRPKQFGSRCSNPESHSF